MDIEVGKEYVGSVTCQFAKFWCGKRVTILGVTARTVRFSTQAEVPMSKSEFFKTFIPYEPEEFANEHKRCVVYRVWPKEFVRYGLDGEDLQTLYVAARRFIKATKYLGSLEDRKNK